jgi:hypothetical protein
VVIGENGALRDRPGFQIGVHQSRGSIHDDIHALTASADAD